MAKTKVLLTENSRTILTGFNQDTQAEKWPQFLGAFIVTLSALCMGMALSWTSAAIPMLQQKGSSPRVSDGQGSWIGSLITLGACLGAIPTGSLVNMMGRKIVLQVLILPLLISWIIIAFGGCVETLYAARFIAGVAIGGISVAAPMYVAELAHYSIRGTLGTFFQVQITIGLLIEYILGATISNFTVLALVSSILPVVFLIAVSFLPESPVFLCAKGNTAGARKSLIWFRGECYNIEDELKAITDEIKEASANKAKLSDLINCKATSKALIISLGLMIFQQLSGINPVLFYTGQIFSETGSTLSPNACAILVGAVQVVATLTSTVLIDKAGRKLLLLLSDFVMSICLVALGIYFHLKQHHDLSHLSIIPLASVAIFIIVFSIGFGPIPWMIMGELFAPNVKGIASSISASFNWILAFTVTNQFQNMTNGLGIGITFGIFGIVCLIGTFFVAVLVPETKGKTVDEVRSILLGENGVKNISFTSDPNATTKV